jgi:hypothetical protein
VLLDLRVPLVNLELMELTEHKVQQDPQVHLEHLGRKEHRVYPERKVRQDKMERS